MLNGASGFDQIYIVCGYTDLRHGIDGFLMLYKRLENGKFQWPRNEESARNISTQEFRWLTEGLTLDPKKRVKKSSPKRAI